MSASKVGTKGLALEELLKAYFFRAGYFAVRGVPYKLGGEDITDIDLWLYERPGASTRRRIIVDIKNKRSPKAAERIIWTKGLQSAVAVDDAIVATTARSVSTRRLAKNLGIVLLDGDAITKLAQSDQLRDEAHISLDMLEASLRSVDQTRRSADWRTAFHDARASLLTGFGIRSANKNLAVSAYFAEQVLLTHQDSEVAEIALRLVYFTASLISVSLDFIIADHAFRSQEDRRQIIIDGLRFGQSDILPAVATVKTAIGLARQYADNGSAVAKQIEIGFLADAGRIPAEIVADYVAKISGRDTLFSVARELEAAAFSSHLPPFDHLSAEAKSFLGVLLDFNGVARDKVAAAWTGKAEAKGLISANIIAKAKDKEPIFRKSGAE